VNSLRKLDELLRYFENAVLALLLGGMIILAVMQIGLRNFADTGFQWADPVLRILVLWLGLAGAIAATRDGKHINIDILSKYVAGRWLAATNVVTELFAAIVCALVGYVSYEFVLGEAEYGLGGAGNIPVWVYQSIIPVAFMLIAFRYLARAFMHLLRFLRNEEKA
jgi:TRAP-type C4-dicarboxylate transport system permease small subunit